MYILVLLVTGWRGGVRINFQVTYICILKMWDRKCKLDREIYCKYVNVLVKVIITRLIFILILLIPRLQNSAKMIVEMVSFSFL